MPFTPNTVLSACQTAFGMGDNKYNCSGFVKDVAAQLGVVLTGQADDIVDAIRDGWGPLQDGRAAFEKAQAGYLVVAGIKGPDRQPAKHNGHVVVVAPSISRADQERLHGDLYHGKYPVIWGGDLGHQYWSQGDKTLGEIFNHYDRDHVLYRYFRN